MKKVLIGLVGLLLSSVLSTTAFAQSGYTIKGTVYDQEQQPVMGAFVIEQGTNNGVMTDANGQFFLTTSSKDAMVEISIIGFVSQVLPATADFSKIVLKEDNEMLESVVVIGYGQVKKSDATGAVIAYKPDELNRVKTTTTTDLLLGKVAGLQITQGSGSPGSSGTIRIRQGASLNASNDPLIVIDGMVDASISSINPEDIESFSVLKDASSAAIYGSRGANGVIIITTKRGPITTNGKAIKPTVGYKGDYSINYNYEYLDVYDTEEFRKEYENRGWDTNLLGTADTNWQKEITQTAFSHKHTVYLRGALPYLPYRVSLGYQKENGAVKGHTQDVATATININPSLLDNHLNIDIAFKDTYKYTPESGGSLSSAAKVDPTWPVYADYGPVTVNGVKYDQKAYGLYMYGADAQGNGADPNATNPLAEVLYPGIGNTKANRISTSAALNYKVHGFEDLKATVSFNGNWLNTTETSRECDNTPNTWGTDYTNLGKGGIGQNSNDVSSYRHYNMDYYLNYNHTFGVHGIDVTLGHSYESTYSDWTNSPTYWNDGEVVSGSVETSGKSRVNLSSWFGRINYNLMDRYLFTATARADASSRFAPETRWGFFPSAAFAWKINNENFMKNADWVSELKLRLSYGITGQQEIGNDYAYQASYYKSTETYMYKEGSEFYYTYRPSAFDRSIQWETTSTKNIGIDYGFLNGRIYGTIDFYDRYTSNLLMEDVKVAAGSNFAEVTDQNIGEMSSRGFEFAIGAIPVSTKDWYWSINANFAWNKSTIEKLTSYDDPSAYVKTGAASDNRYTQIHKVGNTPYTYFLAKQVYDENGNALEKWYNPSYDPSDPNSEQYVSNEASNSSLWDTGKSSLVPFYGGLSTQVRYKNWDFGANAHYAFGQYVFWKTMYNGCNSAFFNSSYQFPMNTYKDIAPYWASEHYLTDHWLYKGDYFKIDNIVVGYTFDNTKSSWYKNLRISLGLQNVATFSQYPGLDPEVYDGIDGSSTPRPRIMMLSLNLDF